MAQKMIEQKTNATTVSIVSPKKNITSSQRNSGRLGKRKSIESNSVELATPKHRQCDKAGCPTSIPICFARVTDRCCGTGWTSRWYHLSPAEHFCNECFEHIYRREGYETYKIWKNDWDGKGSIDVNVRTYLSDQYLPYWLQCTIPDCQKWRQVTKNVKVNPEFISRYTCGMTWQGVKKENQSQYCTVSEDERVSYTKTVPWLLQLVMTPMLRDSPTVPYVSSYFLEDVGLRPTQEAYKNGIIDAKFEDCVQPFIGGDGISHVGMFHPANLTDDESLEYSCYSRNPSLSMYLGARNLVMTMWAKNCRKRLTHTDCIPHLMCRGICRIHYVELVKYIINSFTHSGYINYGLLPHPSPVESLPMHKQLTVLIIGAGAAGLSAAYQLAQNGVKVIILEARLRLGGRVKDDNTMGVCVGLGAQFLSGEINNPISVMVKQTGGRLRSAGDNGCTMNYRGEFVPSSIERRIEFHTNALLDIVNEWKKGSSQGADCSLSEKLLELHEQFQEESSLEFSEEEQRAFNLQLSSLERQAGAPLTRVSSIHWDDNETFPQFTGSHTLLPDGYYKIFSKMSEGLDIRYNSEVSHIDYNGDIIKVFTTSQQTWVADKVILTVPVSLLQTDCIQFDPPLPDKKVKAINRIGCGLLEIVALEFARNFWSLKIKNAPCFGRTTKTDLDRGLFPVFYDLSAKQQINDCRRNVLVTYICGEALDQVCELSDDEILASCLAVLNALFPVEDISSPIRYLVSRWRDDSFSRMAYSYLPLGVDGSVYDHLAESVADRIYFAGEATNREHPQTVTGAYLSGIREANGIIEGLDKS